MGEEADAASTPGSGGKGGSVEERYRKIFRHSNDAIMVVDLDTGSFVDVNPAACELLGYSRPELLALEPGDIHPEDIDRVRETFLEEVLEAGAGFTDDLDCLTKSGERIPTEISAAALSPDGEEGEDGNGDGPARMVAMLRDVSDRVERQRELEAEIERLNRFASVVSHDLRAPLSLIRGRAELAIETGDLDYLHGVEDAVGRMDGMITELLELAKAGTVVQETTAVGLETLAGSAWADVPTGDAELTVEGSMTFEADRDRVRQLFENLFRNAVEHGSTGSRPEADDVGTDEDVDTDENSEPSVRVRVGPIERGDTRGFYVADDGPGIPADEYATVFEWGETTAEDGTGFGLAIVEEIAVAHGWEVTVGESESGGCRFEVTSL